MLVTIKRYSAINFRALQFHPEAWLRFSLHHGSLTWVTIGPSGRVALRYMGDAGFMPGDMMTVV